MTGFRRAILILMPFVASVPSVGAQDVIFLKTGESLPCRVDDITDKIINFSLLPIAGPAGGSARRTIPAEGVDYIEFDFKPGEAAFFEKRNEATAAQLKTTWDFHFAHLHRPRSRTAAYGIAFGNAILREESQAGAARALSVFDRIIERAWSAEDVALAKQGRLRSLMALGDLVTATAEAKTLAAQSEDPGLLIEVNYLLAMADFQKLKILEEEHPRWQEDDEVRPERNELFHRAVDQFLWPHLFHATREELAARGLSGAAELYLFAGDIEAARRRWEDLINLYPTTTFSGPAKERLIAISSPTPSKIDTP